MKHCRIIILLCTCAACIASSHSNTSEPNDEIIIDYGVVEGYGVTVTLLPKNRLWETSCQALIDIDNGGKHRLFIHNAFEDPEQADTLAPGTVLKRNYVQPTGADAKHLTMDIFSQMPFFFLDVDFDGEKELVLTLARQGQKWMNAYQPINLEYDHLYDNLLGKPFTKLDELTEIDYDKKTITLTILDGSGSWCSDIYTFQCSDNQFLPGSEFVSHTMMEYDTWDETSPMKRIITERNDTTEWIMAK